jgi:hypothetical protein
MGNAWSQQVKRNEPFMLVATAAGMAGMTDCGFYLSTQSMLYQEHTGLSVDTNLDLDFSQPYPMFSAQGAYPLPANPNSPLRNCDCVINVFHPNLRLGLGAPDWIGWTLDATGVDYQISWIEPPGIPIQTTYWAYDNLSMQEIRAWVHVDGPPANGEVTNFAFIDAPEILSSGTLHEPIEFRSHDDGVNVAIEFVKQPNVLVWTVHMMADTGDHTLVVPQPPSDVDRIAVLGVIALTTRLALHNPDPHPDGYYRSRLTYSGLFYVFP